MSKSDSAVDVATLLDRSGLSPGGYRTFVAEESARPASAGRRQSGGPRLADASEASHADSHPGGTVAEARPAKQGRIADASVVAVAARLLSQATGKGIRNRAEPQWDALPLGHCLALTGVSGGAGATTILANAAAVLATYGERVLVADEAPSLLPFYFGGENFRSGPASFAPPRGSAAGPVHLVTGGPREGSDSWLLNGLTEFLDDSDRILVSCKPGLSAEALQWAAQAAAVVVLLRPDPSSLLQLPNVLARIAGSGANSEAHAPLLLLNQFEPSNDLHIAIRAELSRRFGEHLLPFVIERDDAFPRCLASGGTVSELAPESRAAEGIRTLVDWLRNYKFDPES